MSVIGHIKQNKIVAILRGLKPAHTPAVVQALYRGGIRLAEITLNSENALGVIKQLCSTVSDDMLIGAGTVLNAAAAKAAIEEGARFIISPNMDLETIALTKKMGVISIPGAYTATEIVNAFNAGGNIVKIFPAQTPQYIKDLHAPLSHIPLMPVGGVNVDNIRAYRDAGGIAFGIGSSLVNNREEITPAYLDDLQAKAAALINALNN